MERLLVFECVNLSIMRCIFSRNPKINSWTRKIRNFKPHRKSLKRHGAKMAGPSAPKIPITRLAIVNSIHTVAQLSFSCLLAS